MSPRRDNISSPGFWIMIHSRQELGVQRLNLECANIEQEIRMLNIK